MWSKKLSCEFAPAPLLQNSKIVELSCILEANNHQNIILDVKRYFPQKSLKNRVTFFLQ